MGIMLSQCAVSWRKFSDTRRTEPTPTPADSTNGTAGRKGRETMNSNEWLQELKAGDTVIVKGSHGRREVRTVQRVTPTQIVVGLTKYHKKDGREVGGDYFTQYLKQATAESVAEIRAVAKRNNLRNILRNLDRATTDALTDSQLERIAAILAEGKEE